MHFLQAINSDISVVIVCNNTGGIIKGDIYIKKVKAVGASNQYALRSLIFRVK